MCMCACVCVLVHANVSVCVNVDMRKGLFVCMYAYSCMYVCAGVCLCEFFLEKSPQLLLYITLNQSSNCGTHKNYFRSISIGITYLTITSSAISLVEHI